ncbi:MAG: hypothetical protein ACRDH9_00135 [Actinomycetota bacterium]
MRRTNVFTAATGLVLALGLGMPASADPPAPQIIDAAGDANFVNANGNTNLEPANGPDTSAVYSESGADFRSIRFFTRYTKVKIKNPEGVVEMIDYRPSALQIDITMSGDIKPAKNSLIFRVQTLIAGCQAWFTGWIRGTQPGAAEVERAQINKSAGTCPGGTGAVQNGFQQIVSGNLLTLIYPFEAEAFSGAMAGFIKSGTQIDPAGTFTNNANYPHVRTVIGGTVTAPSIDQTERPTPFTVGSDVPADVICANTPEDPECAA